MRIATCLLLTLAVGVFLLTEVRGADKEVALKGTIQCAKCSLKVTKKCTTAIVVKEGDKNVVYLLLDKGNAESYHEPVCGGDKKEGTVTGVVSEKDGQKYIKPTKVEYTKK